MTLDAEPPGFDDEEPLPPRRFTWPARLIALLAVVLLVANLFGLRASRDEDPPASPTPTVATPSPTATATEEPATGPLASMPVEIRRIARDVERIRGLRFLEPVQVDVVSEARLDERLQALIAAELEPDEIARTDRTWTTLGLLDADDDLLAAIRALNEGGVAGFYDEETAELVVGVGSSGALTPATRYYVAHELVHALTDQHHDLSKLRTLEEVENASDESFAFRSLVEGDAVIAADAYLAEMSADEVAELRRENASRDRSALARVPAPLLEVFGFPYSHGVGFVRSLHDADGFDAVDRAYRTPPTTTREILHPGSYPDPPGRIVDLLDARGGWSELETEAFGEFDLALTLDRDPNGGAVSSTDAAAAADGWRSGRYRTAGRDGATVVEIAVRFSDAAELSAAADVFDRYLRELAGDGAGTYARNGWQGLASEAGPSGARLVEGRILRLLLASGQVALDGYVQG